MERLLTSLGIPRFKKQRPITRLSVILVLLVPFLIPPTEEVAHTAVVQPKNQALKTNRIQINEQHTYRKPDGSNSENKTWACPELSDKSSMILVLPETPRSGKPIRVIALTKHVEHPLELKVFAQGVKEVRSERSEAWGYVPRAMTGFYSSLQTGEYRAVLLRDSGSDALACFDFTVHKSQGEHSADPVPETGVWSIRRDWDSNMEDLFSAFVAKLFYVRPGSRKGWRPMHQATSDPYRNILYGILGFDEDNPNSELPVELKPDCADAPYQIRAYFAWKMGLPFLFNRCTRGSSLDGPRCFPARSNLTKQMDHIQNPIERFNAFAKKYIGWSVHTGNPRTLPETDTSDFYSIELKDSTIRPGVVFVDSGGHILLVSQWESQTESAMGALYGVDAHPDRTVSHKRFASGTFVFNPRVSTDGFKAFRPVIQSNGKLRFLSNSEINDDGSLIPFSDEQTGVGNARQFYNKVSRLLNPRPVDPREVLIAKIEVLHTAILERVQAVQLGVEYMMRRKWAVMSMPNGASIFQTEGPWETYSTPARDLRCFLAIDDVMKFPDRAQQNLSLYEISPDETKSQLRKDLTTLRDQSLEQKKFQYKRSDGLDWTLTLKDVVERQKELEMAYNPNDCPEIRWAAPKHSEEYKTCLRKTPQGQRKRMGSFRYWFASRRRPDQR
ncbi:MAG: hypothetical protein GY847_13545 [Proteobacteria bacterium]|nr:hypothetical protein [Pseudomonadota bacterium]